MKDSHHSVHARSLRALSIAMFVTSPFVLSRPGQAATNAEAELPRFSSPRNITHAFAPFEPGRITVSSDPRGGAGDREVRRHLEETRVFDWNGTQVECAVVRDETIVGGQLRSVSVSYIAQADDGSVYSFGEDSHGEDEDRDWVVGGELPPQSQNQVVVRNPQRVMPRDPRPGDHWDLETDLLGDERAQVVRSGLTLSTPAGTFHDCIQLLESSLQAGSAEYKWYAPSVGLVRSLSRGEMRWLAVDAHSLGGLEMRVIPEGATGTARVEIALQAATGLRRLRAIDSCEDEVVARSTFVDPVESGQTSVIFATSAHALAVIRSAYPEGSYRFFAQSTETGGLLYEECALSHDPIERVNRLRLAQHDEVTGFTTGQ